jgi:hypothetical protein
MIMQKVLFWRKGSNQSVDSSGGRMDEIINVEKLRIDLMNHYGARYFMGFDDALADALEVDKASKEELIQHAIKEAIDIQKYMEQE